jgi:hypothetical protein
VEDYIVHARSAAEARAEVVEYLPHKPVLKVDLLRGRGFFWRDSGHLTAVDVAFVEAHRWEALLNKRRPEQQAFYESLRQRLAEQEARS